MAESLAQDLFVKKSASDSFSIYISYDKTSLSDGYDGSISNDYYGRAVPKSDHGYARLSSPTASMKKITQAVLSAFDRIADERFFVRRLNLTADNVIAQKDIQSDLFTDVSEQEKENSLQSAMQSIQDKFGKNAILKGIDLTEGATARERNEQIGGHHA